jgi:hypothetical protein
MQRTSLDYTPQGLLGLLSGGNCELEWKYPGGRTAGASKVEVLKWYPTINPFSLRRRFG